MTQGCLILVAGPSGAGKDTLLKAAMQHFADTPNFAFPRRVVTREADAETEDHVSMTPQEFAALATEGGFVLSWQAHGLYYGIPASITATLAAGRHVVINVSRSIIAAAITLFPRLGVIEVTAPPEILLARLAARQRAADGDIKSRVARQVDTYAPGVRRVTIINDGPRERAQAAFIQALEEFAGPLIATVSTDP